MLESYKRCTIVVLIYKPGTVISGSAFPVGITFTKIDSVSSSGVI